jgi:hypothetical protein
VPADHTTRSAARGAQRARLGSADPRLGLAYRQEHYAGVAEDSGEVFSVDEQAEVPFGHFEGVVMTKDFTPLEPRLGEHKLYARGVGPVLTSSFRGGRGREELLDFGH